MKAALVTGYLLCAFTVPMALAAIPGGWLSARLGYRWSVVVRLDRRHRRLLDDECLEGGDGGAGGRVLRQPADRDPKPPQVRGTGFMAAGLALAGIGIGLTIAPIGTAVVNGVGDQERGMASSLVIILRLDRHEHQHELDDRVWAAAHDHPRPRDVGPEDALDLEKTARVALDAVTKITGEMALISLAVAAMAVGVAFLLRRGDELPTGN